MPASEEILSSPAVRSHPVRRALLAALALALVGWGAVARLTGDQEPESPAAAPPPPARSSASASDARPVVILPPPWVRYPTPLEGTWVGTGPPGRVTLVISNARLTLSSGTQQRAEDRLLGFRTFTIAGHRLHVRPSTDRDESATYRWRITRGRLTFQLLETTPEAALRLESAVFHRI